VKAIRLFGISTLSLICFMFMQYHVSVPSFAKEKKADEYLKENELLAEKNPQSFVKRPYWGADIKINSVSELVIIDVHKGSPANESEIKFGYVAIQSGGDSAFSGFT